ncbi:MAG: hypothetical protein ACRC2S_10530 [Waterburya sp.]
MTQRYLLGLPPVSLNCISGGIFVFIVCLGIRVARAPDVGLKIANTQLVVGTSASKLDELARKLDEQTRVIGQKDKAYEQLQTAYEQSLDRVGEDRQLSTAFEKVEKLPEVQNIEEIQQGISETKEDLNQRFKSKI